jgi:hypothetical protein
MTSYLDLVKRAKSQLIRREVAGPPCDKSDISDKRPSAPTPEIHCRPCDKSDKSDKSPDDRDLAGVDAVVDQFRRRDALERALASIPPTARLYFADAAGLPCVREAAVSWAWDGGPTWFQVADHPPPQKTAYH